MLRFHVTKYELDEIQTSERTSSHLQARDAEVEDALNNALEAGYRLVDTARYYCNEHVVGKVLSEWCSAGKLKRKDVFITTKVSKTGC